MLRLTANGDEKPLRNEGNGSCVPSWYLTGVRGVLGLIREKRSEGARMAFGPPAYIRGQNIILRLWPNDSKCLICQH